MTADCTVCYASDLNYLLPSLVSAVRLRSFIPPHKADIFIFTTGANSATLDEIRRLLTPYEIRIQPMDDHVYSRFDKERLAKTLTPLATFSRFFMEDLLPSSCRRIVYLDGDTWAVRDPSPLIDAIVPEECFAAADDNISLRQTIGLGGTARDIRAYFKRLGLNRKQGYFNAGMFAVSRDTWKKIAREAFAYFLDHTDACRHFDQSALNAVVSGRRLRLSNKWNFQTQFKFWGADRFIEPHIYHFNRYPKPWMGACAPWKEYFPQYEKAIAPFTSLNLPIKKLSAEETAQINASTEKTYGYLRQPLVSRIALAGMGFKRLEQGSWL